MNSQFPSAAMMRAAFFNEADTPFLLLDKDLHLLDCNVAFTQGLQLKREDVLGKHITSISPGIENTPRLEQYKEVLRTGQSVYIDDVRSHPSAGTFHSVIKAFRVAEGLGIVSRNITEFRDAIEELETFIHRASRDLSGPVERMLGILQLSDNMVNDLNDARHFFKMLKQHAEQASTVLDILNQSVDARHGQISSQPVDMERLVNDVIESLSFNEGYPEIRFTKDIQLLRPFIGDRLLIQGMLSKVTENCLRFRRRDGRQCLVNMSVRETERGITITVQDNGIGMSAAKQKELFRVSERVKDSNEGRGLGLYYTRYTIKRLGGKLTIESEPQAGTTVHLYIPSFIR